MERDYGLVERAIRIAGRPWRILAVQNQDELLESVSSDADLERFPYGMMLWPSSIALAEWLAEHAFLIRGKRVLELGAGTGLPGCVAQSLGAKVRQTDYLADTIALARYNAELNGIRGIDQRTMDWRNPGAIEPFDLVIAADVLYERALHGPFERILTGVPGMQYAVIADPMRPQGIDFVDQMEKKGWETEIGSGNVELDGDRKEIAIYRLHRGRNETTASRSDGRP